MQFFNTRNEKYKKSERYCKEVCTKLTIVMISDDISESYVITTLCHNATNWLYTIK